MLYTSVGTEGGGIGWGWVGYLAASVGIRSVTSGPSGKGWGIRGAGVTRGRSTTLQVTGIFIALVWTATTQQPDPAREISRFPLTHKHAHTHAHAHAHAHANNLKHIRYFFCLAPSISCLFLLFPFCSDIVGTTLFSSFIWLGHLYPSENSLPLD